MGRDHRRRPDTRLRQQEVLDLPRVDLLAASAPLGHPDPGAGRHAAYYSQATLAGVQAMILTTPLAPGLAMQLAVPVNTVDMQVASVGETLALLSGSWSATPAMSCARPLTSMRINVELLAAEPGLAAGERQEVLDRVVAQVDELGQLVASITELARDEPPASTHQDVRLDEVVAAALATARRDWPQLSFAADLKPCVVTGRA